MAVYLGLHDYPSSIGILDEGSKMQGFHVVLIHADLLKSDASHRSLGNLVIWDCLELYALPGDVDVSDA